MGDATKNLEGGEEASKVTSDFNDIVTSIEHFRKHVDTIMERMVLQQETGVEQLRLSRSSVQEQVQLCVQVLQSWQQHLCMELTGLTSVAVAELHSHHTELQHCRAVLDSALTKVKAAVQSTLPPSDLVELSVSLHSSVDKAANTVLQLDQLPAPHWPEVSLNQGPDSFPEVLSKMSSRALGHVSDAVHIRDALQPLTRTGVTRPQSSVCRQGDWITMAMQMAGSSSAPCSRVLPFLSCVVRVAGLTAPCDVHCATRDTAINLWLQAPPCLGFGELSVSVHCFLKPVPGSPLLLTLQGGSFSAAAPPPLIGLTSPVLLLPRTDALDAQNRSVLCGCVCGRLRPTLAPTDMTAPSTSCCTGECMRQITQQEKSPPSCSVMALSPSSVRAPAEASASAATSSVTNGGICSDALSPCMALQGQAVSDGGTAAEVSNALSPTASASLTHTNSVSPSDNMENLSLFSPLSDTSPGVLTLAVSSRERRSLDLLGDGFPLVFSDGENPGPISQNLARRMREGRLSSDSLCTAPPTSFSSSLLHGSASSVEQQQPQPTTVPFDRFADNPPTSTFSFDGPITTTTTTTFSNCSFPRSLSAGGARRGGGVSHDGRASSVRRTSRAPGPQSRFGPGTARTIGKHVPSGAGGVANSLEVVQGGDFIPLDSSQPRVHYGNQSTSTSLLDLEGHPRIISGGLDQLGNGVHQHDTTFGPYNTSMHASHGKEYPGALIEAAVEPTLLGANHLSSASEGYRGGESVVDINVEVSPHDDVAVEAPSAMEANEAEQDCLRGTCVQVYGAPSTWNGLGAGPSGNQALKSPIGVVQLPDGSVVVCDTFNNRLVQFSEDGPLLRVFNSSPPLHKPSAVVLLPTSLMDSSPPGGGEERNDVLKSAPDGGSDKAVFAVKDHTAIYVFDSGCNQLRVLARRQLSRPYGLTVDDAGLLVTVETGAAALPTITRLHPKSGAISRVSFDLVPDTAKGGVSKPRFISYHRDEVLIVVDLGLDVVAMVSMTDGAVLRRFGRSGTGPGQFRDPSGVVCDADGYMILGDSRNHRIQVFSPKGEFLFVLRVDRPLRRPSGLCLTPCGHLLVINYWENTVVKFRLSI